MIVVTLRVPSAIVFDAMNSWYGWVTNAVAVFSAGSRLNSGVRYKFEIILT